MGFEKPTNDEKIQQLEKRMLELLILLEKQEERLNQFDEKTAEDRMLRRLQHRLFKQQLYSVVTKDEIRQWVKEAAQDVGEKVVRDYMSLDRIQKWMEYTANSLLDNATRNGMIQEIAKRVAQRYAITPKADQE